ncbi:hypothetical protein [Chryseobacterium profundimaris]|uniref:Uncharacterized protein n=1 Tax=Chryseobacterium profundimaris TaxID=1387275 RepID=A0ABY1P0K2_9FLAO|nr:hypothetical protein [Chryseobacterium profundimaris]SMP22581.1 hypothetical protein SAMN06264346_106216 [Chryseobacterium profundimaris]
MAREPFAAQLTSIWIGAFLFWSLSGFKGNFKDQLIEKNRNRNLIIGYLISIIFLILILYILFK